MRNIIAAIVAASLTASPAFALSDPVDDYDDGYRQEQPAPEQAQGPNEWRGRDGRLYCKKSNGTTGLVVGAVGGALIGRTIDTRGDRTAGTLLGAIGGALIGKAIDSKRRCE